MADPEDTLATGRASLHRSPKSGKSRYHPDPTEPAQKNSAAASDEPRFEPLTVRVEMVVVDGPAGKELLGRQARAIREALLWFAEHRLGQPTADRHEEGRR